MRDSRLAIRILKVPTVDTVMAEERAAAFTKCSLKTSAKLAGLKMAVSMCDLTTLEGKDTPGKVAYLCRKALGDDRLTPDLFRFSASTLVNDVLMQIAKQVERNYQGEDYISLS